MKADLKIALVHDDLVQWGGAERVLAVISEIFPQAPIYTSVYDGNNKLLKRYFSSKKIITSFIQKIPGWKSMYKALLPLYPLAFEQFDFSEYDLVISHATRFAKSVITKPQTKHVCYCPTPPRFLWNFSEEKINRLLQPYLGFLRIYDQIAASRVDVWIANSINVQKRIKKIYQADSVVIYPFVDLQRFIGVQSFDGGYLLVVSRLNTYKRIDLVIQAANTLQIPLKIVGKGPQKHELMKIAGPTVEFLDMIDEEMLTLLLAGCKSLIVACEEDFGMAPLEAQALGKPVVAFKKGGVLETIIPGETGYFFNEQSVESLIPTLVHLDKKGYNKNRCLQQASTFSKEEFIIKFKGLIDSLF
ncbi:MAG: glycosyltransferase [Patescibacteria group bacterium]|nr:glycosyltransferase [Patescibacteria group bacterium]